MNDLWKTAIFSFIIAGAVFLSAVRAFGAAGIAPDLVLLAFALLFFRTSFGRRLQYPAALFLLGMLIALDIVVLRFWFYEEAVLAVAIAGIYLFARTVTGEAFLDFLIALLAGTIFVAGASALLFGRPFLPLTAAVAFLLTAAWGAVLWFPVGWLSKQFAR